MPKPPRETVPLCPRCAYDQSGACATWQAQCPLEGTCPECGLRFEWADAFDPHRKRLPWLFEHKPRLMLGVVRALRSWWMALIPPRFWHRVTPAHGTPCVVVLWPMVLIVSMNAAGGAVRACYLYFMGWTDGWATWRGGPATGWARAQEIAIEAWTQPLWVRWQDYWSTDLYWRVLGRMYAGPAATVSSALVCCVALMCLTTSRRICGVKGSHILRAVVYRTAPLGLLYLLWLFDSMVAPQVPWSPAAYSARNAALLIAQGLVLLWGAWWWRSVILTGWQMPRARLAAALIGACDVLAGVAVYAELDPISVGSLFL